MKNRLYPLDLLRVAAFFTVLIFHLAVNSTSCSFGLAQPFVVNGAISMDLFFLLSGFCLHYRYYDKNLSDAVQIKTFFKKRMWSIYPSYLVFFVLINLLNKTSLSELLLILPLQLSLTQMSIPELFPFAHNEGLWFLSCISFSYFLYPYLHTLINSITAHAKVLFLFFLYLLCSVGGIAAFCFHLPAAAVYCSPILRCFQFVIGILVCEFFLRTKSPLPNFMTNCLIIVWLVLWCIGHKLVYTCLGITFYYSSFYSLPFFSALILIFALINKKHFLYLFSCQRAIQVLCGISFSVYLCQGFMFWLFKKYDNFNLENIPCILLFIFGTLVLAYVYDKLIQRLKRVFSVFKK